MSDICLTNHVNILKGPGLLHLKALMHKQAKYCLQQQQQQRRGNRFPKKSKQHLLVKVQKAFIITATRLEIRLYKLVGLGTCSFLHLFRQLIIYISNNNCTHGISPNTKIHQFKTKSRFGTLTLNRCCF